MSIIDMEQSNLPIDYLLGVLPRAQYGDESVVSVGLNGSDVTIKTSILWIKPKVSFLIMVL